MEEGKFLGYIVTSEGIKANLTHKVTKSDGVFCHQLARRVKTPCASGEKRKTRRWIPLLNAIKGHVWSDFLAKNNCPPSLAGENTPTKELPTRAGRILIDPKGVEYSYALWLDFSNSNKDAEYEALLEGLRIATWMKVKKMQAFVDSKLVASQISHIPREKNKKDDALSKLAAVQCEGLTKGVLVEELNERSMDVVEINVIVEEEGKMWMTLIREYIEKGTLPDDSTEVSTIREKVNNYVIEDGILYKKSYLGPLLRCIGPLQANRVIREIHIGSGRMHDGQRRVVHKAMNAWYYWPSIHRDANNKIKSCDACQAYATVPRLPKDDMISVTSAWPFRKWIIDIVGPLPEALGKLKYLIVAVDYYTKWLKAKPVASITGRQVKSFAFDNIVCRFGVLDIIITDNGTHLINEPFKSWAEGLEIKLISTSVNTRKQTERWSGQIGA
ncbi:reverse transcriptase domain-containing protein [Tanacetum coccineum]